ncbi:hypothetical protein SCUCBS95973_009724 [Sporothrix curviconia]|uniref:Carbohydrate-binding module family 19 domain-containing protein n=1 Tax=Sporothrix curviconia TaxID=1260050 RepID=A0ABP0CXB3_9PEZI
MKYTATLIAAATAVAAMPSFSSAANAKRDQCTFGTYACLADGSGVQICDIEGNWELVGACPGGTSCEYLPQNGYDLPFCTSNPTANKAKAKRDGDAYGGYDWCPTPGQYTCDGWSAIQVCNTTNGLEKVGDCPAGSHCGYINNIPFCVE